MASMAMVGCTQDEEQFSMNNVNEGKFAATIMDASSRTSMGSDGQVIWSSEDSISIFLRGGAHQKWQADEGGSASASFSYAGWSKKGDTTFDQNYAVYPFAQSNSFNGTQFTVDLSGLAEQTYTANTFESGKSVMTAKSEDNNLPFYNALSMLLVRLNAEVPSYYKVKKIEVKSETLVLNGSSATINMEDEKPVATLASGNKVNVLDCGDGVELGDEAVDFYILMPANKVVSGDVTITISGTNLCSGEEGVLKTETISSDFTFERSMYVKYERTLTVDGFNCTIETDTWDGGEGVAWTGDALTSEVIEINSAQDLANFAATVNGGNSLSGKTVKLMVNIDLNNKEWTPIGYGFGGTDSKIFSGTFDGNGKIISNLNIEEAVQETAGLFGYTNGVLKNFTIDGATINVENTGEGGVGVVAGLLYLNNAKAEGITVKNAEVTATRRVGAIAGYLNGTVTGCTVEKVDFTIVPNESNGEYDNGDKVGGVVGYMEAATSQLTNNTLTTVAVTGYRDLGGVAGCVTGGEVKNNSISNVTLTINTEHDYEGYASKNKNCDASPIVGDGTSDSSNTVAGVTYHVSSALGLTSATNGSIAGVVSKIVMADGDYTIPTRSNMIFNYVGSRNVVVDAEKGIYMDNSQLSFEGITIKIGLGYANGVSGDYAAIYSPNAMFTNCKFVGGLRVGRDGAKFSGCEFDLTTSDYDYVYTYGNDTDFTDCTFNTKGKALIVFKDGGSEISKVNVSGCTFTASQKGYAGVISNQECAAIEIDNSGCGVVLTCSEGNNVGDNFSGLWRIKTYISNGNTVTVNGTTYSGLAIDGKSMTINGKEVTVAVE